MAEALQQSVQFLQAKRAIAALGKIEPTTAWEVDTQLFGWARLCADLVEAAYGYTEHLDKAKVDFRVVNRFRQATGGFRDVYSRMDDVRTVYREVYRPLFEIAESGTSVPDKPGFWDSKNT